MEKTKIIFLLYKSVIKIFYGSGISKIFPFLKNIHHFFVSRLKPSSIEVDGHIMYLDTLDTLYLSINKVYEPLTTKIVKETIKKGNVVLDIGAHIGYYTLIFARLVGDEGKVFAFEPAPANFALLRKNVIINKYQNVIIEQKAVSNRTGKARLYLSENNTGDHRIVDTYDGRKYIEIETVRLDDYFNSYEGKIHFIKIDIQGAEGLAIQGMSSLLQKNKELKILTEFMPSALKAFGVTAEDYLKILATLNFKFYQINEEKNQVEPITIAELLKTYTPGKNNSTNLLCVRE